MSEQEITAQLRAADGEAVALKGVNVRAGLRELLATVEVEQRYENPRDTNIEAVYTFPLPIGAVLLGLELELGERKLAAQVVEKREAEARYEDAITDGNTAVMLHESGPGLYTMNVGNLLAREVCVIRFRYAVVLHWQGDRLRFVLPTTIAPRYGDPLAAGLQPHAVPTSSLAVDYPLQLELHIEGSLADGTVASPSHAIDVQRDAAGLVASLAQRAALDRDLVITVEARHPSRYLVAADEAQFVAQAAIRIPAQPVEADPPLQLKLVIDCSGSMSGTSIIQARKAALEILQQLRPQDYFAVTLFGNHHEHLFPQLVPADAEHLAQARTTLATLGADLGGTEIGNALEAAFKLRPPRTVKSLLGLGSGDGEATPLILITDGEIWNFEPILEQAKTAGHRIFTVGVGASVAEGFVRSIATVTGGACELVAPQEGMAERILSQFHRLRQPAVTRLELDWGTAPRWQSPLPATPFAGDTVVVSALFDRRPASLLRLKAATADDTQLETGAEPDTGDAATAADLPRIVAAARIAATEDQAERLALALRHQLLTDQTNLLVIAVREQKAQELPELHQVPQMLAAGWGGTGTAPDVVCAGIAAAPMAKAAAAPSWALNTGAMAPMAPAAEMMDLAEPMYDVDFPMEEAPAELPMAAPAGMPLAKPLPVRPASPDDFAARVAGAVAGGRQADMVPQTIAELESWGLSSDVADALREAVAAGKPEPAVVAAFLYVLAKSPLGGHFDTATQRLLLLAHKASGADDLLVQWFQYALAAASPHAWNWRDPRQQAGTAGA